MSRLFQAYKTLINRYPLTSQSIQTALITSAGDVLAQTAVEKKTLKNYNFKRTFQFGCVGLFYVGPALTVWYRTLQKHVGTGGKYYGLKKMALDQICFAPVCLAGFIVLINMVQGQSMSHIKATMKNLYPEILLANYKVWPAVQIINFTFVPLHFQVLYVQTVALLWNTYICYKTKAEES